MLPKDWQLLSQAAINHLNCIKGAVQPSHTQKHFFHFVLINFVSGKVKGCRDFQSFEQHKIFVTTLI